MCKSRAAHRALVTCNMSCNVPSGTKGQLSYEVWQSWNRIYLSFILLPEPLTDERGEETGVPGENPLATSFRKCHILHSEDSSPNRDADPHNSIGGRLGKQTCWPLHHTSALVWLNRACGEGKQRQADAVGLQLTGLQHCRHFSTSCSRTFFLCSHCAALVQASSAFPS